MLDQRHHAGRADFVQQHVDQPGTDLLGLHNRLILGRPLPAAADGPFLDEPVQPGLHRGVADRPAEVAETPMGFGQGERPSGPEHGHDLQFAGRKPGRFALVAHGLLIYDRCRNRIILLWS